MSDQNGANQNIHPGPTAEQLMYANVLQWGMYIGLLSLIVTFFLYASGIMEPYIAIDRLPEYWKMKSTNYLEIANVPHGWGWLRLIGKGDFVNFISISILAGVTMISYISIIPILLKNKEYVYTVLVVLEVLILAMAASGIVAVGGH